MLDEPTEEAGPDSQPGSLPLCLLVYGPDRVQVVRLGEGKEIVVGRAPPANLVIKSPSLSRRHAKIVQHTGEVWIEDLGSKNGTRVNGRRIDRKRLYPDDQIGVGNVVLCLHAPTGDDVDPNPSLFSHDHFRTIVELEIDRARTFHRRLALILAREAGVGNEGGLRTWYPRVRKLLRSVDRLAQYGPRALEVVLAEAGREEAERVVERIVREQTKGQPPILCGVALFPDSATSADELLEASRYAAQHATADAPICFAPSIADAREPAPAAAPIVQSEAMRKLYDQVDRLARATIPVLVLGETGAGKEVVAQELHRRGPRATGPIRCINCAAIPSELIESVLFGHVRGAFTGAEKEQIGVFEAADGGTLLLDEVGELSGAAQAALLRVLETKTLTRVGSTEERTIDVRVIAATHRDLDAMVTEGKFRSDLLYRLNAITLQIPPLRERPEEIPALVDAFGDEAARTNGAPRPQFTPAALTVMQRYDWPGNIRELRNVIEYAVVIADGETIDVGDLPDRLRDDADTDDQSTPIPTAPGVGDADFKARIRTVEEAWIREVLEETGQQKTQAAEQLRIPVRTLSHKLSGFDEEPMPKLGDAPERRAVLEELDRRAPDRDVEFKVRIQRFEASLIEEALAASGGNKAQASRALGIPLRTLVNKVRSYGL